MAKKKHLGRGEPVVLAEKGTFASQAESPRQGEAAGQGSTSLLASSRSNRGPLSVLAGDSHTVDASTSVPRSPDSSAVLLDDFSHETCTTDSQRRKASKSAHLAPDLQTLQTSASVARVHSATADVQRSSADLQRACEVVVEMDELADIVHRACSTVNGGPALLQNGGPFSDLKAATSELMRELWDVITGFCGPLPSPAAQMRPLPDPNCAAAAPSLADAEAAAQKLLVEAQALPLAAHNSAFAAAVQRLSVALCKVPRPPTSALTAEQLVRCWQLSLDALREGRSADIDLAASVASSTEAASDAEKRSGDATMPAAAAPVSSQSIEAGMPAEAELQTAAQAQAPVGQVHGSADNDTLRNMGHMGRSVERVSSYLEHASACTNVACPLPACAEVKAMFVHSERCAYRSTRGCDECWRLSTMLSLHSRDCKATMCPVPHCLEEVPERVTDLPDRHQGLGSHPHAERMLAALLSSSPGNGSPHAPSEAGASQQAGYMSAATIMAKSSPLTPLLLQCLSDRHALISVLPLEEPLAGRVSGTAPLPAHELVLVGIFDAWCADVLDGVIPLWDDPPASTDALFQSAEAPALLTRAASMPLLLGLLRYVPAYRGAKVAAADIVSTAVRDSSIILICGPPLDDPAAWAIVKAMLSFLHIAIGSAKSDAFLGQVAESVLMGVSKALTAFVNPSKWHGARAIAVLCISEPSVITILGGLLKSGGSLSKMGAELLQLLLTCFPRKVVEAASDHGHAEAPDLQAEWQSEATPADMRSIEAFSTAVLTADGHILELLFANLQDAHAASSARVGTKAADRKHSGTTCALAQVANPFWTPICALSFHPTAWRPLWAGKAFEWALTMLKVAAAKVPQTLALPQALLYEQTIFCISKLAAIPQLLNHVAAPRHGDGLAELFACLKRPACAGREEAASALKRLVQLSPMDNLVLQPSSRVGVAGLLGAWDDASDDWGLRYGIACMLQRMIRTHQTAIAFFPYVKHVWARLAAAHREAVASMAAHVDASAAALQLTDALLGLAIKYPAATEAFQAQQVGKQVAQAMWMVLDGRSAPSPDPVHDLAQRKCALEIACSALQHLNEEHDYQDEAMQATWEVLGEHVLAYPTQVLLQDEEPLFFHWAASCCRVLVMAILHSPPTQAHFAKQHYLLAAWQQLMATLQLLEEGANPDAERRASLEGCFYALTGLVTCLQEASKSSRPTLTAIQGGTVFRGCKLLVAALTARLCPPDQVPAGREALEHWSVHMRDSCMFFRSLLSRGSTWLLVAVSEDAAVQLISTLHGIMRVSADLFDMYKAKSAPADARLMTEAIRGTAGYIITTLTYFPDAASILRRCKDKGQSLRAAMNFRGVKSRLLKPEALKMLEGLLQASEQDTEAEATAQAAADALVQEEEAAAQRSAAAQQKKKLKKKAKQKSGQGTAAGSDGSGEPATTAAGPSHPDDAAELPLGPAHSSESIGCKASSPPAAVEPPRVDVKGPHQLDALLEKLPAKNSAPALPGVVQPGEPGNATADKIAKPPASMRPEADAGHAASAEPDAPAGETNKQRKDRERKERAEARRHAETAVAEAAAAHQAAVVLSQQATRRGGVRVAPPTAIRGSGHSLEASAPAAALSSNAGSARQQPLPRGSATPASPLQQHAAASPAHKLQRPKASASSSVTSSIQLGMFGPSVWAAASQPAVQHIDRPAQLPSSSAVPAPASTAVGGLAPVLPGREDSPAPVSTRPMGLETCIGGQASTIPKPSSDQVSGVAPEGPSLGSGSTSDFDFAALMQQLLPASAASGADVASSSVAPQTAAARAAPTGVARTGSYRPLQHQQNGGQPAAPLADLHDGRPGLAGVSSLRLPLGNDRVSEPLPPARPQPTSSGRPHTAGLVGAVSAGWASTLPPVSGRPQPSRRHSSSLLLSAAAPAVSPAAMTPATVDAMPKGSELAKSSALQSTQHSAQDAAENPAKRSYVPPHLRQQPGVAPPRGEVMPDEIRILPPNITHAIRWGLLQGHADQDARVDRPSEQMWQAVAPAAEGSVQQLPRGQFDFGGVADSDLGVDQDMQQSAHLQHAVTLGQHQDPGAVPAESASASASDELRHGGADRVQVLLPAFDADEMCCPITHDFMQDPVIAEDGHTYDRAAIVEWFSQHDTSPMTNQVLATKVLIPNILMRRLIQSHLAREQLMV